VSRGLAPTRPHAFRAHCYDGGRIRAPLDKAAAEYGDRILGAAGGIRFALLGSAGGGCRLALREGLGPGEAPLSKPQRAKGLGSDGASMESFSADTRRLLCSRRLSRWATVTLLWRRGGPEGAHSGH